MHGPFSAAGLRYSRYKVGKGVLDTTYISRRDAREYPTYQTSLSARCGTTKISPSPLSRWRYRTISRFDKALRRNLLSLSLSPSLFVSGPSLSSTYFSSFFRRTFRGETREGRNTSKSYGGSKASCAPHQSLNRKRSRLVCRPIWRTSTFLLSPSPLFLHPLHRRITTRFSTWPRLPRPPPGKTAAAIQRRVPASPGGWKNRTDGLDGCRCS